MVKRRRFTWSLSDASRGPCDLSRALVVKRRRFTQNEGRPILRPGSLLDPWISATWHDTSASSDVSLDVARHVRKRTENVDGVRVRN